jgi:hypothetical protein
MDVPRVTDADEFRKSGFALHGCGVSVRDILALPRRAQGGRNAQFGSNLISTALQCRAADSPYLINRFDGVLNKPEKTVRSEWIGEYESNL